MSKGDLLVIFSMIIAAFIVMAVWITSLEREIERLKRR